MIKGITMKKFTALSTAALLAIFLTACDKPVSKTAETATPAKETAAASTPAKEAATPAPAKEAAPAPKADTGEQDYKTFRQWKAEQERAINSASEEAMKKLGEQADPKVMQETLNKVLMEQIEAVKASAEKLDIQDEKVKALKDKTLEVLALGLKMMEATETVAKNPTEESHKALGELQTQLNKLADEGLALEAELTQKYEPAPAQPAAPAEQPAAQAPSAPVEAPKAQ